MNARQKQFLLEALSMGNWKVHDSSMMHPLKGPPGPTQCIGGHLRADSGVQALQRPQGARGGVQHRAAEGAGLDPADAAAPEGAQGSIKFTKTFQTYSKRVAAPWHSQGSNLKPMVVAVLWAPGSLRSSSEQVILAQAASAAGSSQRQEAT